MLQRQGKKRRYFYFCYSNTGLNGIFVIQLYPLYKYGKFKKVIVTGRLSIPQEKFNQQKKQCFACNILFNL